MLTRKMSEELKQQIDNLTAQLEAQRLQIERLLNCPASSSNALPSPSNARETAGGNGLPRVPDAIKMIVPYKGDKKNISFVAHLSGGEAEICKRDMFVGRRNCSCYAPMDKHN